MIGPAGAVRVMVATKPVDFRKGAEGLSALVRETMMADPFSGVVYVFRAKRADRIKLLYGLPESILCVAYNKHYVKCSGGAATSVPIPRAQFSYTTSPANLEQSSLPVLPPWRSPLAVRVPAVSNRPIDSNAPSNSETITARPSSGRYCGNVRLRSTVTNTSNLS